MNWIKDLQKWHSKKKHLDATLLAQMWPDLRSFVKNIIDLGTLNHFTKTPYILFRESAGKNRSVDIDAMIKRNGGTLGDPYCVFGIQDILRNLETEFGVTIDLPKTGGVLKLWEGTKNQYKTQDPSEISIGCYQKADTRFGHAVLVLNTGPKYISTFEFNTSDNSDDSIVRDGEGAHYKNRIIEGIGEMKLLGFIDIAGTMLK